MNSTLLRGLTVVGLGLSALQPLACGLDDEEDSAQYDLDNVCEAMAPRICAARAECCDSEGHPYSQSGCEGYEIAECEQNVAKVNAGELEYHRENVEDCVQVIENVNRECAVGIAELIALIPELKKCAGVFVGSKELGDSCDTDADCKPSTDPNVWAHCGDVSGECEQVVTHAEGEDCELREPCADGLYCQNALSGDGTCEQATPVGQSCDMLSGECGLGAYCDAGECAPTKGEGESCATGFECQSFECAAGECTAPGGVANAENCGG